MDRWGSEWTGNQVDFTGKSKDGKGSLKVAAAEVGVWNKESGREIWLGINPTWRAIRQMAKTWLIIDTWEIYHLGSLSNQTESDQMTNSPQRSQISWLQHAVRSPDSPSASHYRAWLVPSKGLTQVADWNEPKVKDLKWALRAHRSCNRGISLWMIIMSEVKLKGDSACPSQRPFQAIQRWAEFRTLAKTGIGSSSSKDAGGVMDSMDDHHPIWSLWAVLKLSYL